MIVRLNSGHYVIKYKYGLPNPCRVVRKQDGQKYKSFQSKKRSQPPPIVCSVNQKENENRCIDFQRSKTFHFCLILGKIQRYVVLSAGFLVLSVVIPIGNRKTTESQQKACRAISSDLTRKQKEKRKVLDPPAKYSVRLVQDFDITSSQASLSFLTISWPF